MEEPSSKGTPEQGFNKLDLSQLQDFRFGTQWTETKPTTGPRRENERDPGTRRSGRRTGENPSRGERGGQEHRDRRGFRRPAGQAPAEPAPGREQGGKDRPSDGLRQERPPRGEPLKRRQDRSEREPREKLRPQHDHRPYQSPWFNVAFYPEDTRFSVLVKTMRASCRTFELFEIARLIIDKPDRYVVAVTRKPAAEAPLPGASAAGSPAADETTSTPASPAGASSAPTAGTAANRPPRSSNPIYVAAPDGLPFESEEAAIDHVMSRHLGRYFDTAVVEIDPPKGNFPHINRCTLTGELLGPSNYHLYQQTVQQHHAAHFPHMPFERFRERIETVRDPEVVAQWLEKMKKITRHTLKPGAEGGPAPTADSLEDARKLLLAQGGDKVVKAVESARFPGKALETLPRGEIRRAIEGHWDRQRRFPLDTANTLRGRLRREGFTIFKKGAKGVSYVCAVRRKFRTPGQVFADSIGALISFLETNPMTRVKELPVRLLGITPPPMVSTPQLSMGSTPPVPAAARPDGTSAPAEPAAPPAESTGNPLTPGEQEKLKRLAMDLRWLVTEGYVTEFADGRLFAPPPMAESRAKAAASAEGEEHDPDSFPEVPAEPAAAEPAAPAAALAAAPAGETPSDPVSSPIPSKDEQPPAA